MARKRKRKEQEADVGFDAEDRQRLTPVDVQEKVFRLAFRGYSERDVDEFLDRITEDLAALHEENKRLREQLAEGGATPGGLEDAERQAEAIVRQAREHAARLVEDAEARADAAGAVGSDALPTSFLLRERQFLQQMAGLIQDHARRLKEEARRASTVAAEGPAPEGPAAPIVEAAPSAASSPPPPPPPAQPPPSEQAGPTAEAAPAAPAAPSAGEERSIVLPEAAEERTAPWTQVDEVGDEDQDPLLSAWESAFTAEGSGEPGDEEDALHPSEVRNRKEVRDRKEEEGEPSLRELFWGDEG